MKIRGGENSDTARLDREASGAHATRTGARVEPAPAVAPAGPVCRLASTAGTGRGRSGPDAEPGAADIPTAKAGRGWALNLTCVRRRATSASSAAEPNG